MLNLKIQSIAFVLIVGILLWDKVSGQSQYDTVKPGDCPPPTQVEICHRACTQDNHCADIGKCCPTSCGGSVCTHPVTKAKQLIKPGECPEPGGAWVCTSQCSKDANCRGKLKCCPNRCGAMACQRPNDS